MKKLMCVIFAIALVAVLAIFLPSKKADCDYLRLQIYSNSDCALDMGVKYQIKDEVVNYLTPYLNSANNKDDAIKMVNDIKLSISELCKNILKQNNLKYAVNVKVESEYFEKTQNLDAGFYDAIVVELGAAAGKNESCVIYPPLNLKVNKNVKFESKIFGWLKSIFD